jgi:hypothetical protein
VAGEDYCIVAADTRMSTGFSIMTRDCKKIMQLCAPFPLARVRNASANRPCGRVLQGVLRPARPVTRYTRPASGRVLRCTAACVLASRAGRAAARIRTRAARAPSC